MSALEPRSLLLLGSAADARRPMHEAVRSGAFASVERFDDMAALLARAAEVPGAACLALGDASHLNQDRLAAYMALRHARLTVAFVASVAASIDAGVKLRDNVFIDRDVRVLEGANIGANTWILRGSEVGAGVRIASSCWIGEGCRLGDGASLGKNCTLGAGVALAPGVELPAWTTLLQPTLVARTPPRALFVDDLFRSPVELHGC